MEGKFSSVRQQRLQQEEQRLALQFAPHPLGNSCALEVAGPQGSVAFELLLNAQFPLKPPRVRCTTHFLRPSLADGRDLLPALLPWTPQAPLASVVAALPAFLVGSRQTQAACAGADTLASLGAFHLGEALPLALWENQDRMGLFRCLEIDPHNPKLARERLLVVTELSILQLEASRVLKGYAHVTAWSTFAALAGCSSVYAEEDRLTFQWRPCGSTPAAVQLFKLSDVKQCLSLLDKNMSAQGFKVTKQTVRPRPTLREEEVSRAALKKVKIDKILADIKKREAKLEKNINSEAVTLLMGLIQQAIEYLSAQEDPRADDYLMKLRNLLQREDVLKTLAAIDEPIPGSGSQTSA